MQAKTSTAVLLGLGTNRPYGGLSCCEVLQAAVRALGEYLAAPLASSVYRTAAMYMTDQSDFFNMALMARTTFSPHALLRRIHLTEARYGRARAEEVRNGPRTLDIDIELFGDEVIDDKYLTIPHPRLYERAFVLVPAMEVIDAYNAGNGTSVYGNGGAYWSSVRATMVNALEHLEYQRVERV